MRNRQFDTSGLYRMPWTMSDNAFSWLEPTRSCNLACEYCYQRNDHKSHKSLNRIDTEMREMMEMRKCDTMLIAGGEPLIHPEIVEITRLVKSYGVKPVFVTNGQALTPGLLLRLKKAGAFGFVFHVDTCQNRPGWEGRTEKDLNQLRQGLADMVYRAGGMICAYNTTIVPETLDQVPEIVKWTTDNAHKVAANVLITVRGAHEKDPWEYYAGSEKIEVGETPYASPEKYGNLMAADIIKKIRVVHPAYRFHSFIGGTVHARAPKWVFGTHMASKGKILGYMGARTMEVCQNISHLTRGRYLSFTGRRINRHGRALMLPFFDESGRKALRSRLMHVLRNPFAVFRRVSLQSIIVMQPHDIAENGEHDECDGCPNKTYWKGRLVSECRKEDYLLYGRMISSAPKATRTAAPCRTEGTETRKTLLRHHA